MFKKVCKLDALLLPEESGDVEKHLAAIVPAPYVDISKYSPKGAFILDETGLFCKMASDRTISKPFYPSKQKIEIKICV